MKNLRNNPEKQKEAFSVVYGLNTVKAYLKTDKVLRAYISSNFNNKDVLEDLKKKGIETKIVDKGVLDTMTHQAVHQGILLHVKKVTTVGIEEIISISKKRENPIVVMLDGLNDPHNLGAILRSSDAFGVSGIIYKKKGSVSLNETVAKVSTGAINFVKCCEATNLTNAINTLKKAGFWVIGLDGNSNSEFKDVPKNAPICLIVGSEGFGISRLVKENCDLIVKIPMQGHVDCLNASVACGIALYALRNN